MDHIRIEATRAALKNIAPHKLTALTFVRAYDTLVKTLYKKDRFFDSTWSFERGFRFNFKNTWPVFCLACDNLTASAEIGPRTRKELLGSISSKKEAYIYVCVNVTVQALALTKQKVRSALGIIPSELLVSTETWDNDMDNGIWAVTHHMGKLAQEDGRFGGILYPSYPSYNLLEMRRKYCIAIFMDKSMSTMSTPMKADTLLEVVDKGNFLKESGIYF